MFEMSQTESATTTASQTASVSAALVVDVSISSSSSCSLSSTSNPSAGVVPTKLPPVPPVRHQRLFELFPHHPPTSSSPLSSHPNHSSTNNHFSVSLDETTLTENNHRRRSAPRPQPPPTQQRQLIERLGNNYTDPIYCSSDSSDSDCVNDTGLIGHRNDIRHHQPHRQHHSLIIDNHQSRSSKPKHRTTTTSSYSSYSRNRNHCYQVNHQSKKQTRSKNVILSTFTTPREPSTDSSSSSSTTSPSEASFDLDDAILQQQQNNKTNSIQHSLASESTSIINRPNDHQSNSPLNSCSCNIDSDASLLLCKHCQCQLSTQQRSTTPRNSSTFWDLITDVAKDLDLTLQDLSPDSEIFEQPSTESTATTTTASNCVSKSKKSLLKNSKSSKQENVVIGNPSIDQQQQQTTVVDGHARPTTPVTTSPHTYTNQSTSPQSNITTPNNHINQHDLNQQQFIVLSKRNQNDRVTFLGQQRSHQQQQATQQFISVSSCPSTNSTAPPSPPSPFANNNNRRRNCASGESKPSSSLYEPPDEFACQQQDCNGQQQQSTSNITNHNQRVNVDQQQPSTKTEIASEPSCTPSSSSTSITNRNATSSIIMQQSKPKQHISKTSSNPIQSQSTSQPNRYHNRTGHSGTSQPQQQQPDKCSFTHTTIQQLQSTSSPSSVAKSLKTKTSNHNNGEKRMSSSSRTQTTIASCNVTTNNNNKQNRSIGSGRGVLVEKHHQPTNKMANSRSRPQPSPLLLLNNAQTNAHSNRPFKTASSIKPKMAASSPKARSIITNHSNQQTPTFSTFISVSNDNCASASSSCLLTNSPKTATSAFKIVSSSRSMSSEASPPNIACKASSTSETSSCHSSSPLSFNNNNNNSSNQAHSPCTIPAKCYYQKKQLDHDDLIEGNVDDDNDDLQEDSCHPNAEQHNQLQNHYPDDDEEEEEMDEDEEPVYEVDADDEQSNDMLDETEDDDDDEQHGPQSTSPPPVQPISVAMISQTTPAASITKIDCIPKSMVQVISMKVNSSNQQANNLLNTTNTATTKGSPIPESEDSAADVSYERTSENESDIEDTTITTVNTSNPNNIDLKELNFDQRFKMTQSIWYLPHINRATVVHYLQGKTVGVFIVRQSSKPNTMAVSVRLPQGRGPHVEHYLIEKVTKAPTVTKSSSSSMFRLEGSEHYFISILQLVIHYSNCQDELPVQLGLPSVLLTSTRSQLASLALLGQEFWQSKFVSLKQLPKNSLNTETLAMINHQNCDIELRQSSNVVNNRQPRKRHNSNSSESNASKSSMSCSPMANVRSCHQQPNTSEARASPTIPKASPPPPLPPKSDSQTTVIAAASNSPLIATKNNQQQADIISSPTADNQQSSEVINGVNMPKLPPKGNHVAPPLPPRSRNSPGSTPPPPPLPASGPPLSSLRSKKPSKPSAFHDLLSPMSMTESEVEMAKFSMAHKLGPDILEVEEYEEEQLVNEMEVKARRNYYNHMIQVQQPTTANTTTTTDLIERTSQQTPTPAPAQPQPSSSKAPISPTPAANDSTKCDVCTQTYETKQSMLQAVNNNRPSSNSATKITRANSSLSCFYMDPIDALVAIHAAHQPKRHSDPELSSSHNTNEVEYSSSFNQTLTFSHSLESLLETFRNRFSSAVSSNEFNSIRQTIINERRKLQQQTCNGHHEQQPSSSKPLASLNRPDAFSTIDSAWQWHSGQHKPYPPYHRPPSHQITALKVPEHLATRSSITTNGSMKSDITTVEDLISAKAPELAVPKITHIDSLHLVQQQQDKDRERKLTAKSTATDACTEFSEPWNLELVESMFLSEFAAGNRLECNDVDNNVDTTRQLLNNDLINFNSFLLNQEQHPAGVAQNPQLCEDDYDNVADDEVVDVIHDPFIKRDDSDVTLKDGCIVSPQPRTQSQSSSNSNNNDNGIKLNIAFNISNYVFELASRKDNTFAKSIDNFIECTKESTDPNPTVILGYVRQFMNGMKNYLIKHGEGDFINIVQNERSRLKPNQFLNIDSILEVSLQKLIIKPLKNFIYELFIRSHTMSGSLKILSTNIKLAQNKSPEELGIRAELLPIEPRIMAEIQKNLRRLQQSYSPIKKLEHLLRCVAILNGNYREKMSKCMPNGQQSKFNRAFSGDDLLPMLVYLIVHCGVISAEIESEYMLGLLHPSILNGEGSYYLTVLSSAIQVLKTMYTVDSSRQLEDIIKLTNNNGRTGQQQQQSMFSVLRSQPSENLQRQMSSTAANGNNPPALALPSIANLQAYMKIMIPNELTSSITCKTVPVRHNMTTKEICRMIAHTYRITNPEDYALYRIKENGLEEIQLLDNAYPQVIKSELMARGESAMFAYKRCDAKFIWPITSPN